MTPVDLAAVPSHTPLSPTRTQARLDPFYDALWSDGTHASWVTISTAKRRVASGTGKLPAHLIINPGDAWARFRPGLNWHKKLAAIAAIDSWRTVSAEQLAAITGYPDLASGKSAAMSDLFAMGLVDIGVFSDAMYAGPKSKRARLYRPGRNDKAFARLAEMLTYPEWVAVTGGNGFEFTRQFDRHNLIATELGLRAAEFSPVGTTLGEKLSTVDALAYTGWGVQPPAPDSQRAADLTVVRRDGVRIAVEITASSGRTMDAKIARWANTLARRRFDDTGLVVLFVVAGRLEAAPSTNAALLKAVRSAITASARLHPGPAHDRTANRMLLTTWTDWFPERGKVSESFGKLRADRPVGEPGNPWLPVSLLDEVAYPFTSTGNATALIDNATGLASVPHWLRGNGNAPSVGHLSLSRAGFETTPHLTGLTDKGAVRAPLASPRGAAGVGASIERLRYGNVASS